MEAAKQDKDQVQVDGLIETVYCPMAQMFMAVESCQKCDKHDGIETMGVSPTTKRDLRRVLCLVPSRAEIHTYSSGMFPGTSDPAILIVNCGPWKTLRPLTECMECGLHGGVVDLEHDPHKPERKEVLCRRTRGRPCSYLAIGLKEVT